MVLIQVVKDTSLTGTGIVRMQKGQALFLQMATCKI